MDEFQEAFRVLLNPPHYVAALDMGHHVGLQPQQMGKASSADVHHIGDLQMGPQIVQHAMAALIEKVQASVEKEAQQEALHAAEVENLIHNFSDAVGKQGAGDSAEDNGTEQGRKSQAVTLCGAVDIVHGFVLYFRLFVLCGVESNKYVCL